MQQITNYNKKETSQRGHAAMSKMATICFFLLAFSPLLNAQSKFGLQIGTSYNFKNSDIGDYNFGVSAKLPLSSRFTIEPSLNVFPLGTETTKTESTTRSYYSSLHKKNIVSTTNKTIKTKNNAISADMPVFVSYRFSLSEMFSLQLGMGPYVNYLFSGKTTTDTTTKTSFSSVYSTTTSTDEMETDTKAEFSYGGMLRAGLLIGNHFSVNIDYVGYDSTTKKAFDSKALMLRLGYLF